MQSCKLTTQHSWAWSHKNACIVTSWLHGINVLSLIKKSKMCLDKWLVSKPSNFSYKDITVRDQKDDQKQDILLHTEPSSTVCGPEWWSKDPKHGLASPSNVSMTLCSGLEGSQRAPQDVPICAHLRRSANQISWRVEVVPQLHAQHQDIRPQLPHRQQDVRPGLVRRQGQHTRDARYT